MFAQTIALIRFQLLGVINRRLLVLMLIVSALGLLVSQFAAGLALVEGDRISNAVLAEYLRYALSILLVALLAVQITQDYENGQFERLLAMPIRRAQYLLSLFALQLLLSGLLGLGAGLLLWLNTPGWQAVYWGLALWLELLLLGQFVALSALTLEKLAPVLLLTLALYLLARGAPVIELILQRSARFYEEGTGFRWAREIFSWIRLLLPGGDAFARNDLLMGEPLQPPLQLGRQLIQVAIYSLFLEALILADFYRKEFGRS